MLSSHETEEDFYSLYSGLKEQCEAMDLTYEPEFVMQDACNASYNAVKRVFPEVSVLVCYWHVLDNIRKHKHYVDEDVYQEILKDMKRMHISIG